MAVANEVVLNDNINQYRLEALLESDDSLPGLVADLVCPADVTSTCDGCRLLAALAHCAGNEGYAKVLDILEMWRKSAGQRCRFQPLVEELKKENCDCEGAFSVVHLINSLLSGAPSPEDRISIRNELLGLKLLPFLTNLLKRIREENEISGDTCDDYGRSRETAGELEQEVERFHQMKLADLEEQRLVGGPDLNSPLDIFYAIERQVADTPSEAVFLNILQHLLQIDAREELSECMWNAAERLVFRVRLIDSKEEAEKLVWIQNSTQLLSKLRTAEGARCHCNCHSNSTTGTDKPAPVVLNPPPPPPFPPCSPTTAGVPPPPAPPLPAPISPKIDQNNLTTSNKTPVANGDGSKATFAELLSRKSKALLNSSQQKDCEPAPPKFLKLDVAKTGSPGDSAKAKSPSASGSTPMDVSPLRRNSEESENFPPVASLPQQQVPMARTKLKTFAWNKVPVTKVVSGGRNNLWLKAADHLKNRKELNVNFDRLEELFCQSSPPSTLDRASNRSGASQICASEAERPFERRKRDQLNLLAPKRSLNVNIFLKQFRRGVDDLLSLIDQCNGSDIGLEKLRALVKVLPELDEIETLTAYTGDKSCLGTAEQFFLSLIQVPNYQLRIDSMLLKEEFASVADYTKPSLDIVILAAKNLKGSKALQEVMLLVLMVGNYLNSGSYGGNAAGFRMTSLWKLVEVRANKPNVTLLHFVAQEAETRTPSLLDLPKQLKHLDDASKLSLDTIKSDIRNLREKMTRISNDLQKNPSSSEIKTSMSNFLKFATTEQAAMEEDLREVEKLRLELADFFCEDPNTFKLEECFRTFNDFCNKFTKALQENSQRRIQEEKTALRKRQQDWKAQQTHEPNVRRHSSSATPSLAEKYGLASEDYTLTAFYDHPPDRSEEPEARKTSLQQTPRDLYDVLAKSNSEANFATTSLVDSSEADASSAHVNPWGSLRRSGRNRRASVQGGLNQTGRERRAEPTWRERVNLLRNDRPPAVEIGRGNAYAPSPPHRRLPDGSPASSECPPSAGNIDKPLEHSPIYSKTRRWPQRDEARLSAPSLGDLRAAPGPRVQVTSPGGHSSPLVEDAGVTQSLNRYPRDEARLSAPSLGDLRVGSTPGPRVQVTSSGGHSSPLVEDAGVTQSPNRSESLRDTRRALRPQSLYTVRSSGAGDLGELLQTLETEKQQKDILTKGRKYRWRETPSTASLVANDDSGCPALDDHTPPTGRQWRETVDLGNSPVLATKSKSNTKTDIDEVVRHCERTKEEIERMGGGENKGDAVKVQLWTGDQPAADCDRDGDTAIDFTISIDTDVTTSTTLPLKATTGGDDDECRSATSDDVDRPTSESPGGDRDEGFETESHSTTCSVDKTSSGSLQNTVVEVLPGRRQEDGGDRDANGNIIGQTAKKRPSAQASYLSGTKASSARLGLKPADSTSAAGASSMAKKSAKLLGSRNSTSATPAGSRTVSDNSTISGATPRSSRNPSNVSTPAGTPRLARARAEARRVAPPMAGGSSSSSRTNSPSRKANVPPARQARKKPATTLAPNAVSSGNKSANTKGSGLVQQRKPVARQPLMPNNQRTEPTKPKPAPPATNAARSKKVETSSSSDSIQPRPTRQSAPNGNLKAVPASKPPAQPTNRNLKPNTTSVPSNASPARRLTIDKNLAPGPSKETRLSASRPGPGTSIRPSTRSGTQSSANGASNNTSSGRISDAGANRKPTAPGFTDRFATKTNISRR